MGVLLHLYNLPLNILLFLAVGLQVSLKTYLVKGSGGLSSAGCDLQSPRSSGAKFQALQLAGGSFLSLRAQLNCRDLETPLSHVFIVL